MAAATPVTTTLTYPHNHLAACSFALSTVLASGSSGMFGFDVPKTYGRIKQIDIAFAGSGVATVSIFSKDVQVTGSLYEVVKVTGLSTSFHAEIEQLFVNAETTPVNTLYIIVTETGGAVATGAMTFIVWVEV